MAILLLNQRSHFIYTTVHEVPLAFWITRVTVYRRLVHITTVHRTIQVIVHAVGLGLLQVARVSLWYIFVTKFFVYVITSFRYLGRSLFLSSCFRSCYVWFRVEEAVEATRSVWGGGVADQRQRRDGGVRPPPCVRVQRRQPPRELVGIDYPVTGWTICLTESVNKNCILH